MTTSRAHLVLVLAAGLGVAGGSGCTKCASLNCGGGGSAIAVPGLNLGSQTGATTATATYPNPCEIDLDFGNVPIGLIDSVGVQVENTGTDALDVSPVMPTLDPEFGVNDSTEPPIEPGSFGQFTVTFQPYKVGPVTATFAIQTDGINALCPPPIGSSTGNLITVTLTGTGVQLSLVVQPNVLDFGDTFISTTVKKSVTLINKSSAPVTGITANVIGGDANLFVVNNAPATLGASDSAIVDISYSPLALETRSLASVEFAGSDGENTSLELFGEPVGVALALAPNPIDFGFVPVGATAVGCTTVSNQSTGPVEINGTSAFATEGAFAVATTDDATPPKPFTFPTTAASLVIDGGASARVCFQFTPPITQHYEGQVALTTDDPSGTDPIVQLTGWGGGPQISCTPPYLDFGATEAYTAAAIPVTCTNVGSGIPGPGLIIDAPKASPSVFSAQLDTSKGGVPLNGLAPGQSAQIDVSYVPTGASSDEGTLTIASNGGRGQPIQIALSGQGLEGPPCQFAVSPTAVDFGNVAAGQTSVAIPFEVRNVGTDRCVVQSVTFPGDAGGSFHVASATPDWDPALGNAIVLPAPVGGVPSGVTFMLEFEPTAQGDAGSEPGPAAVYSVEAVVSMANPASTGNVVALSATSGPGCLEVPLARNGATSVFPADAGAGCASGARSFSVLNRCSTDETIQSFAFQLGPWDVVPQFSIQGPPLPLELGAGATAIYEVLFDPTSAGVHTGEILISDGMLDAVFPAMGLTIPPPAAGCQ